MATMQQILQAAQEDLRRKDFTEASEKAHTVIKAEPMNSVAWHILGLSALQQDRYQEAVGYLKKAIQGQSKPLYHFNLGLAFKRLGQINEAIDAYRECLKKDPKLIRAWSNLGNAYRTQDRNYEAERCYKKAIDLEPDNALAHFNLGILYHLEKRYDDAIRAYRRTIKYDPSNAKAFSHLGTLYSKLGRYQKSLHYYQKAIELDPYYFEAYNHYGGSLIELGRLEEAETQLRKALKLRPKSANTLRNITLCKTYHDEKDKDALYILKLMESPSLSQEDKVHLHFALGKIYHQSKAYEKAFHHYQKGNEIHYRLNPFNIYGLQDYVEDIKQLFDESFVLTHKNLCHPKLQPIIIVGPPRSGKSLLESLLSQHPDILAAGELGLSEFASSVELNDEQVSFPQWVQAIDKDLATTIVQRYENKVLLDNPGKVIFIDTMPGNAFYLGLFVMLYPNAKIISMERNLEDLGVSMYFKYFINRHFYSYDLTTLGQFLKVHEDLMAHWDKVLMGHVHKVSYEHMVAHPQETLHKLLAELNLDSSQTQSSITVHHEEVGIASHYRSSLKPFQEGLSFDPTSNKERIYHVLSQATEKHKQEQLDEADKLYRYVLQLEPDNPVATHLIGVVAFDKGNAQEGIKWIHKAIALNPDYAQAHHNLAAIYQQQGDLDNAQHHYELAQRLIKAKDIETFKSLTQTQGQHLKSAFLRDFPLVKQFEKKLLYRGESPAKETRFIPKSVCKDLSYGAYRRGGTVERPIEHSESWHELFKYLNLVESLYQSTSSMLNVLDIDCGQALLRRFIEGNASMNESKEIYYWGLDSNPQALEKATTEITSIESGAAGNFCPTAYLIHDCTQSLPYCDEFFDLVVYFEKLQHHSLKSGVQLIHEMDRVLKFGGTMVLSLTQGQTQPGTLGHLGLDKLLEMLTEKDLELVETLGCLIPANLLMKGLKPDHKELVSQLLRIHPKELIAAMFAPLYPDLSTTKVLVLKKQKSDQQDL